MSRASIIESIKTPLGFFALAILILEAGLLGSLGFTPAEIHDDTLYIFAGLMVLLILCVLFIEKKSSLDLDSLGLTLGTEIFYSFDPYISNLPDNEREEAYQSLIAQMKLSSDTKNKVIREKIAEVISERASIKY